MRQESENCVKPVDLVARGKTVWNPELCKFVGPSGKTYTPEAYAKLLEGARKGRETAARNRAAGIKRKSPRARGKAAKSKSPRAKAASPVAETRETYPGVSAKQAKRLAELGEPDEILKSGTKYFKGANVYVTKTGRVYPAATYERMQRRGKTAARQGTLHDAVTGKFVSPKDFGVELDGRNLYVAEINGENVIGTKQEMANLGVDVGAKTRAKEASRAASRAASPRAASPRVASPRAASPRAQVAAPTLRAASPVRLPSPRRTQPVRLPSPRVAQPARLSPRLAQPATQLRLPQTSTTQAAPQSAFFDM